MDYTALSTNFVAVIQECVVSALRYEVLTARSPLEPAAETTPLDLHAMAVKGDSAAVTASVTGALSVRSTTPYPRED